MKSWKDEKKIIHMGKVLGTQNGFDVVECLTCGFNHAIPIPTDEFLKEYYKNQFIENRPDGHLKRVKEDVDWWKISYNEKYDIFERHISKNNRSILDIGSGLGYFVKCGKDRGWQAIGVEPSIESCNYSKKLGLVVVNEYLDESNYQELGKFDVVHMHTVIEHLPDPVNIIKLAKKMLNPGGLICIESPNDFNPLQQAFTENRKSSKWWISPPEHINYFNFLSIKQLLVNQQFNIVEQTSSFPLELFLLMGDNYIGNSELGRTMHSKRKHFEMTMLNTGNEKLRRKIYHAFSEIGIGREFCVIGKLND